MNVATKQIGRRLPRPGNLNQQCRGFRSHRQDKHNNNQSPAFDRVSQLCNQLFSSCSSTKEADEHPPKVLKFREKSIADRRLELGLNPTAPSIDGKIGSLPLAVVQSGTKQYPLVLEEASVVAGATGMLKLIGDTFTVKHLGNNTCVISCKIPFTLLTKSDTNGKEMAEGIVDIYKFSEREPMRAITNNKGILNAVYPFLKAFMPSQALILCVELLANTNGIDFLTGLPQYGPLIHWSIKDETLVASLTFSLDNIDLTCDSSPFVDETRRIIGLNTATKSYEETRKYLMEMIGELAIAQNLAALRSIWYKGNRAHHMDYHHAATKDISNDQLSRFDRLVECCIGQFDEPLSSYAISSKLVAYMGNIDLSSKILQLMSHATIDIELKQPEITAQVVLRKVNPNGKSIEDVLKILNSPKNQDQFFAEIMNQDGASSDATLSRLAKRIGGDIRVQRLNSSNQILAYQIGTNVICLNTTILVGETQGANRANAYAEISRSVFNKYKDELGWEAKGGILSNWHTDRGPTFDIYIPKQVFEDLNIDYSKLIALSKRAMSDQKVAQAINLAALEAIIATDTATGQDTRGNIASFDFASREIPMYGHGMVQESRYRCNSSIINPWLIVKDAGDNIHLQSGFPMGTARTAVGRTVNNLDCAKDARDIMEIPIEGDATGKVNELDERTCLFAVANALQYYLKVVEYRKDLIK